MAYNIKLADRIRERLANPSDNYKKRVTKLSTMFLAVLGVVAITQGKLDFGPWEQIFYGEFDGQRKKRVLIKIIGD